MFRAKSLAKYFKRVYFERLEEIFKKNRLIFFGKYKHLEKSEEFQLLLDAAAKKNWIVYAKKPFAGPDSVLEYLGRHTHRTAISNHRIKSISDGKITFSYKDRSNDNKKKLMTLDAHEFIRRLLLHVLPKGFMKIRSFGFLANRCKKKNFECIRNQLGAPPSPDENQETICEMLLRLTGVDISLCPKCKKGRMSISMEIKPDYRNFK